MKIAVIASVCGPSADDIREIPLLAPLNGPADPTKKGLGVPRGITASSKR